MAPKKPAAAAASKSTQKRIEAQEPKPKASRAKTFKRSPGLERKGPSRMTRKTQTVKTDLFQTTVANLQRNIGYKKEPDAADFVGIAHQHFYRTFDSDGVMHTYTTPVANHFHKVTILMKDGKPELDAQGRLQVKLGPALQMTKKGKGQTAKTLPDRIPMFKRWVVKSGEEGGAEEVQVFDDHTHEAFYLRSDEVELREQSTEAAALVSTLSASYTAADGKVAAVPSQPGAAQDFR